MGNHKITELNELAKKHNLYFYASFISAAIILAFSVVPEFAGGINSGVTAHGFAYFVFSFTTALYFRSNGHKAPLLKGALLAGLYGAFIELVQFFIPYRNFDLLDILVNFSSALIAVFPNFVLIRSKWI